MNILVFGACSAVWYSPFVQTLKESGAKVNTLAYASLNPLSHIYNILREKNQDIIKQSDMIIFMLGARGYLKNDEAFKRLIASHDYVYKFFNMLQKKVVVIQWSNSVIAGGRYTNFHKMQCEKYGFNFIDTHEFCLKENLIDFYTKIVDMGHPMPYIFTKIAKKINENLELFQTPKPVQNFKIPNFKILDFSDFINTKDDERFCNARSYLHRESVLKIEKNIIEINFPKEYLGMKIIGVHTWNECFAPKGVHSCAIFENDEIKMSIWTLAWETFRCFDYDFIIKEKIKIHNIFDQSVKRPKYDEYRMNSETNKQSGIIGFLLLPQDEKLEEINFTEEEVHIQDKYNFTHLSTYLKDFKIFTEQYNKRQDPIKLAPLQKQIQEKDKIINSLTQEKQKVEQDYKTQIQILNNKKNELQNELKSPQIKKVNLELLILEQDLFNKKLEGQKLAKSLGIKTDMMDSKIIFVQANSAKARIQNHLAYKIGQVLIQNSKNLWGYIRMPFILSYIKDKYNKEQSIYKTKIKENPNLALPPLESYPDYKEALKEKECFTYKLGEAFIQANQNWYKGGYISFYFKD
ncbi:TPA: hypothetical protein RZH67_001646, partial [Campylobacter coli]|nr:hypothetical protein [Campylobacter coli]